VNVLVMRVSALVLACMLLSACGGSGNDAGSVRSLGLTPTNITLDPFGTAPLSARLQFTAPEPGRVSVAVLGKGEAGIEISHTYSQLVTDVDAPVLGLYFDHTNEVVVDFAGVTGTRYSDVLEVATQPFLFVLEPDIVTNNLPADDSSLYFFSRQRFAFDSRGEVRWLYTGDALDIYRKQSDGSLLASSRQNAISYHSPGFVTISMLGETLAQYDVVNYMHHEVRRLPWGNYLVAGNSSLIDFATNGVPEEDVLLEISAATGLVVKSWDFNQILDPGRPPLPTNTRSDDWLHMNSAAYSAIDNSIYITSQRQSLVAKIDYDTGDLLWILGAHEGWPAALQSKLLTAVDASGTPVNTAAIDFWPYGPHAVQPLADGKLAIYDNGAYRGWFADNTVAAESYSRAVSYAVDESSMTVQIDWAFDAGRQYFTAATGDIDYFPETDRYLVGFAGRSPDASTPRLIEVDRSGNILFEAVSNPGTQEYRAEKLDLYQGL